MSSKKDIRPHENGEAHGYWVVYWDDGVVYKGHYVNSRQYGYTEWGLGMKKFYLI